MSQPSFNPDQIQKMLQNFVAKASDPKTIAQIQTGAQAAFAQIKDKLGESWVDAQDLYHMAFDEKFGMDNNVKYACIGAMAYLVSPIDLLPEKYLGPIGLADDVAVMTWALNYARPEIARYRAQKAGTQNAQAIAPQAATTQPVNTTQPATTQPISTEVKKS